MNARQVRAELEAVREFLPAWDAYSDYVLACVDTEAKPSAAKFKRLFNAMRKAAKPLLSRISGLPRWTLNDGPCLYIGDTAFTTPDSLRADVRIDRALGGKGDGDPLRELAHAIKSDAVDYANELRAALPVAKDKEGSMR